MDKEKLEAHERLQAAAMPAIYANRFVLTMLADGIKVGFLDTDGEQSFCRCTIAIGKENARILAQNIMLAMADGKYDS